ncbi:hypothetical protein CTI12_AA161860 [Artemisia annua]|uniref:Uncharacterized protein n=1 Tax=Artemisia annua TaxID=35608 RepID=A0A2U1PDW1_ARTAN|nr:hypothetical protein CTI12_AA161860 [Artemisia annua]
MDLITQVNLYGLDYCFIDIGTKWLEAWCFRIHHDRRCPKTTTLPEAFRVRYRLSYGRCLCWKWFARNMGSGVAAGQRLEILGGFSLKGDCSLKTVKHSIEQGYGPVFFVKSIVITMVPCVSRVAQVQGAFTYRQKSTSVFQEELRTPQESQHGDAVMESIVKKRDIVFHEQTVLQKHLKDRCSGKYEHYGGGNFNPFGFKWVDHGSLYFYTLFPLVLLLETTVECRNNPHLEISYAVTEGVLCCLEHLLIKCHAPSLDQMVVLLKKLTTTALLSSSQASEEFRVGVIRCFTQPKSTHDKQASASIKIMVMTVGCFPNHLKSYIAASCDCQLRIGHDSQIPVSCVHVPSLSEIAIPTLDGYSSTFVARRVDQKSQTHSGSYYMICRFDNDIGSGGPLRILPLRDKREVGYTTLQQPEHASQKLPLMNESEPKVVKGAEENRYTSMHATGSVSSYANVPTKSTNTATKILQHLEKLSTMEKKSGSTKSPTKLTLDMIVQKLLAGNMGKIHAAMIVAPKRKLGRPPKLKPKILETPVTSPMLAAVEHNNDKKSSNKGVSSMIASVCRFRAVFGGVASGRIGAGFKMIVNLEFHVQWDDPPSIVGSKRVSLWKIDTYTSHVSTSLIQLMTPKNKSPRSPANNLILGEFSVVRWAGHFFHSSRKLLAGNMGKIHAAMIVAPKRKLGGPPKLKPKILETPVTSPMLAAVEHNNNKKSSNKVSSGVSSMTASVCRFRAVFGGVASGRIGAGFKMIVNLEFHVYHPIRVKILNDLQKMCPCTVPSLSHSFLNCTEEQAESLQTWYWRLVGDGKAPFRESPDEQTPIRMK